MRAGHDKWQQKYISHQNFREAESHHRQHVGNTNDIDNQAQVHVQKETKVKTSHEYHISSSEVFHFSLTVYLVGLTSI